CAGGGIGLLRRFAGGSGGEPGEAGPGNGRGSRGAAAGPFYLRPLPARSGERCRLFRGQVRRTAAGLAPRRRRVWLRSAICARRRGADIRRARRGGEEPDQPPRTRLAGAGGVVRRDQRLLTVAL